MEELPPWMKNFEFVMAALTFLSVAAVLMILLMHLWLHSACRALHVC
jgi:hypothetical protein